MIAGDTPEQGNGEVEPGGSRPVDSHERWQRTAIAAFFLAEARGFVPGHELDDWLTAERLVDEALMRAAVHLDSTGGVAPPTLVPVATPARRARKMSAKPAAAGTERPPTKKAATARKSASRTRKTKPGTETDLGGMA